MTDLRPPYKCTSRPPPPNIIGTPPVLSLCPLANARITASTRSTSTLTKPRRYSSYRSSTPRVLPSFREIAVMVLVALTMITCSSVSSSGKVAAAPITVDVGSSAPENEIYGDAGPSREALEEVVTVADSTSSSTLGSFGGTETTSASSLLRGAAKEKDDIESVSQYSSFSTSLRKIQVIEMVNVAKGKPAKQSSQYGNYEASRAVDGNINGHSSRGSITHTKNGPNPYWQVDLVGTYRLDEIKIFNREDCCKDRLKNFEVIIKLYGDEVWTYSDKNSIPPRISTLTVPSVLGDSIVVKLPGQNRVLTLAEVEAYGKYEEPDNYFVLWDGNSAGECPIGLEVSQNECLQAGNEVSGLNMETLDVGRWNYTPCGCFTYEGRKVNFKDQKYGQCRKHPSAQPVCKEPPEESDRTCELKGMMIGSGSGGSLSTVSTDLINMRITGKGRDIWGSSDSFYFAKQVITEDSYLYGNFEVVVFTQNGFTDPSSYIWAKFGLMVRDSMDAKSKHFSIFISAKQGACAHWRKNFGEKTSRPTYVVPDVKGGWMKVVRNGNNFRAYFKRIPDGDADKTYFELIGEETVQMTGFVEVGVALSSHETDKSDEIDFSNFSVKESTSVWSRSIGLGSGGQLSDPAAFEVGNLSSITGKGRDIWGSSDSFHFSSVNVPNSITSENFEVVVFTQNGFTDPSSYKWAKFGLMVRDSMDAKSKHFSTFISAKQGACAHWRKNFGEKTSMPTYVVPDVKGGWLKIQRSGDRFRSYYREDGVDTVFKLIGEETVQMSGSVEVGVALSSHEIDKPETLEFEMFSLEIGVPPSMFVAQQYDFDTQSNCLKSNGKVAGSLIKVDNCDRHDKLQQFSYSEYLGLLSLQKEDKAEEDGYCISYESASSATLEKCDLDDLNQRFVGLNDGEFYLNKDRSKKLSVGNIQSWSQGKKLPAKLNKAISLQESLKMSHHLCLEYSPYAMYGVWLRPCLSNSKDQEWIMHGSGVVRNEHLGKCLSRKTNEKKSGIIIEARDSACDEWHWRDGSLYLDSDEEYLVQHDGVGHVLLGYIPNERHRGIEQRWIIADKKYSEYHKHTDSIRIRNESNQPLECSLSQLGPVYWGVIYPGEEFYRNTGAVHWTVACNMAPSGVGSIRVGDAIWPVAELVVGILVAMATAGASAAASAATQAAASVATSTLTSGALTLIKTNNFGSMMSAMAITVAAGGVTSTIGVGGMGMKALMNSGKATAVRTSMNGSMTGILVSLKKISTQRFSSKVQPAILDAFEVSAKTSNNSLKSIISDVGKESGNAVGSGQGILGITNALSSSDGLSISDANEYANGKLYIVRGGYSLDTEEENISLSPLRFDKHHENKSLYLSKCSDDSDCMFGDCGHLLRGEDQEDKVCCGETDYFGFYYYCLGSTPVGKPCWFDDQCENKGYCEGICKAAKAAESSCSNDDECESKFCNDDKCTPKLVNGARCPRDDEFCESDACGSTVVSTNNKGSIVSPNDSDYQCCPNGLTTVHYDFCAGTIEDGRSCVSNKHCISGYCKGSNGMGWVGTCFGPYEVGEECPGGEDDMCYSKECGYEEAGGDKSVCCASEAIEHGGNDYCSRLEDGKKCWLNVMCKSGFCANNRGGAQKGQCATKSSIEEGGECYMGVDDLCTNGLGCGKKSYHDYTYVCCKETFVPAGWTTDLCNNRKLGETCPTTEDPECEGSLECGWENASDNAEYKCCKKTGIFFGNDYCLGMPEDSVCRSDAQCASGYCKGNNSGITKGKCYQRRDVGKSCDVNNDCQNRACGRADAGTDTKNCCSSGSTSRWTNQKDYCNGLSVGTQCHQDSNCEKGGCGRAWYGTDTKKCCNGGVTRYVYNQKDYCKGMPNGYKCATDAMCSSGWCNNDRCQERKWEGKSCNSQKNAECYNRSCYRSTRYGSYKCCSSTNFCDAWDGGCTTGYHYCRYYGNRLG